ncbi:MAG: chloramphenicol acetyltransferase [Solobacterium sp.]|nr:chloramphenicol acetyltransferase [Solobacterium sp.]
MKEEINPHDTSRGTAFDLWMKAVNPMVTFMKTLDVTNLVRISRKRNLKFNMLMDWCIGKAASDVKEFYLLPVNGKLMKYDRLAVNTIVKNKDGEVNSCDVPFSDDMEAFHKDYLKYTSLSAEECRDIDFSEDSMVIGTSAITDTELDGAVGMNTGFFSNPFLIWGRYRKKLFRYELPLSFQFHHTQMDGAHAGRFLENLQNEISQLKLGGW